MPILNFPENSEIKRVFVLVEDGVLLQNATRTPVYSINELVFAANELYPKKEKHLWALALKTELLKDHLEKIGEKSWLLGPIQSAWIEKRVRLGEWDEGYNLPLELVEYIELEDDSE